MRYPLPRPRQRLAAGHAIHYGGGHEHHDRARRRVLSLTEIARGVGGSVRLMKGDLTGLVLLDRSREGFWRSFRVAGLLAPIYAFYVLSRYVDVAATASDLKIAVIETLRYCIEWTLFPVVLLEMARGLSRTSRYTGAVVALNWANVPLLIAAVALLSLVRLAAPPLLIPLSLAIDAAATILVARILKYALDVSWVVATGLALLNLWLGMALSFGIAGILGLRAVAEG